MIASFLEGYMRKILISCFLIAISAFAAEPKDGWNGADYNKNSEEQKAAAKKNLETMAFSGNEKILDIGCGDGYLTSLIRDQVPDGSVTGIDLSPSMIAFASDRFKKDHLSFRVLDARQLDYNGQFDLVTSFTTLHWIPDQLEVLQGIEMGLKSGGKMIADMPTALPKPMFQAVEEIMAKQEWSSYFFDFSPGWKFFTVQEYQELLDESGLEPTKIALVEVPHTFPTKGAFIGFLKQWFPYLSPLPNEKKGAFLEQVVNRYLELLPPDAQGRPQFIVNRMRVEASKL